MAKKLNKTERRQVKAANVDATRLMKRWYKAAKDGKSKGVPNQITRHERRLLKRLIALELLKRSGVTGLSITDLP